MTPNQESLLRHMYLEHLLSQLNKDYRPAPNHAHGRTIYSLRDSGYIRHGNLTEKGLDFCTKKFGDIREEIKEAVLINHWRDYARNKTKEVVKIASELTQLPENKIIAGSRWQIGWRVALGHYGTIKYIDNAYVLFLESATIKNEQDVQNLNEVLKRWLNLAKYLNSDTQAFLNEFYASNVYTSLL